MEVEQWNPESDGYDLFSSISGEPYAFLLQHEDKLLIGMRPFLVFKSKETQIEICRSDALPQQFQSQNPISVLEQEFNRYVKPYSDQPFFQGGLVGYFSYDLGRIFERLSSHAQDDQNLPDMCCGFYDRSFYLDPQTQMGYLAAVPLPGENLKSVRTKVTDLKHLLQRPTPIPSNKTPKPLEHLKSNFTKQDYLKAVRRAKDYIAQGDIYQVNLSQRFTTSYFSDPFELFKKLIQKNPAPHSAYFKTPEVTLLSLSPERLLKIQDRTIQTCPIKGTRPRGRTPEEDEINKKELSLSPKDDSELLMIIDLERNDLGKVCEYGSVDVSALKRIEEHPSVFHLAGDVHGTLKKNTSPFDCLRAAFPGGSITGAPKIRAMEIIEELEPTRRNLYTGCFGFISFNGQSDLSILIRTATLQGKTLTFQVGGGIVADSDPEAEYQETLDKGKVFFDVLNGEHRKSDIENRL